MINMDNTLVVVVDVETTAKAENIPMFAASPFYEYNEIVLIGYTLVENPLSIERDDLDTVFINTQAGTHVPTFLDTLKVSLDNEKYTSVYIVGHNIKFDLEHIYTYVDKRYEIYNSSTDLDKSIDRDYSNMLYILNHPKLRIWDTQFAQFMYEGHRNDLKFVSLDTLCEMYHLPKKDPKVKELLHLGADKIPIESLRNYLSSDVLNTFLIVKNQYNYLKYKHKNFINSFLLRMDSMLATLEMELAGIYIDEKLLASSLTNCRVELEEASKALKNFFREAGFKEFSLNSPKDILKLVNGGMTYATKLIEKVDEKGNPVLYKTSKKAGQPVLKKVEEEILIKGLGGIAKEKRGEY